MRRPSEPFITVTYDERVAAPVESPPVESPPRTYLCDLCEKDCDGDPAGKGLFLWWRGTEMRFDEPPLCEDCAKRITLGAASKWALEDEEEG